MVISKVTILSIRGGNETIAEGNILNTWMVSAGKSLWEIIWRIFFTTFHTLFEEEVCDVARYRFTVQGIIHTQLKREIKEFWVIFAEVGDQ